MEPSLKNPILKIERAKQHLDILDLRIKEFQELNPFQITKFEDPKNGLYILRLHIPIIDLHLAIIASDAIYSLRSALDQIAWQLALTKTNKPHERTAFPIIDEETTKKLKRFEDVTGDIPNEAIMEIKALQPYLRRQSYKDDLLWKLDKLCNIDKHRVIPASGTALDFKIPKNITSDELVYGRDNNDYLVAMPIRFKAQMEFALPPTTDIILGSEADGLTLSVRELPNIYKFVRDSIIPRFARFFNTNP